MIDVSQVIAYEAGEMEPEEVVLFFADLISSGLAWSLQGSYGRMAASLIDAGMIDGNGTVDWDRVEAAVEGRPF